MSYREADVERVRALIEALDRYAADPGTHSTPRPEQLTHASIVPGWVVYKASGPRSPRQAWAVLTPDERPASVPWAIPPTRAALDTLQAAALLWGLWRPHGAAWLRDRGAVPPPGPQATDGPPEGGAPLVHRHGSKVRAKSERAEEAELETCGPCLGCVRCMGEAAP